MRFNRMINSFEATIDSYHTVVGYSNIFNAFWAPNNFAIEAYWLIY